MLLFGQDEVWARDSFLNEEKTNFKELHIHFDQEGISDLTKTYAQNIRYKI